MVGNRLSSLGVNPYNYNSSNELTSIPSGSYGYDNNGNRKSDPSGAQYSWDFENRLTQVVLPGTGGTVNFKYDPFGRTLVCFESGVCETVIVVGGIAIATVVVGYLINNWYESRSRGNSGPIARPDRKNPGQCDKEPGKCNPCPPDSPYWEQPGNKHGGTTGVHYHWYRWNQLPYPDCTCIPDRESAGTPPTGGTPYSPGGQPWP